MSLQPSASVPGRRVDGGWKFQHQLGIARGTIKGRGDCGSHGHSEAQGHEHALPPTAQTLVEGQQDVGHAPRRTKGALSDQLYPRHITPYVPKCGGPGRTAQHRPLHGPGLPLRRRTCFTLALTRESVTLTHQVSKDPRRGRPPIC